MEKRYAINVNITSRITPVIKGLQKIWTLTDSATTVCEVTRSNDHNNIERIDLKNCGRLILHMKNGFCHSVSTTHKRVLQLIYVVLRRLATLCIIILLRNISNTTHK